ncbi:hypothetical protein [Campylobacter geochelonis]|uniref:Putative cytochrome C-type heme-binding periplasmic protein n=1 Tax=Campylobacter geochelonis TaxID=1780362 RepID=A0A128ECW6_9BACT|nr:hypothetical protein [Campylobacter geochelonis]QKF70671.1 molybdopterin-containing oxidoreductase II, DMSO/TMAO/BSO reductase family, monoheme c-type cytochrome [Campylobacter geochelonis]CZE45815.1 putative cytochrome C-type heme-binding periplasmic protein [Campylobacter geochelonis]CZE46825.1 putative cytochrome C-type heme-binding periplasmic protein [Campylobacter geochelonis]CZE50284.1 putative cytochrome C-type heme-binding periplasmic protein [Campylobacter geochelonis]
MKKISLAMLLACGTIFASELAYPNTVKSLYLNPADKSPVGRLLPTAEVKILEHSGDFVKIQIQGYVQGDKTQAIYFSKGPRILNAAFKKNSGIKEKVLEKDGEYSKVSVEAYTTKDGFEKELKPMMDKASALFSENCAMCHALHEVNEYTANQWPSVFKSMVDRTAIDKNDRFLVEQYLQKTTTKK